MIRDAESLAAYLNARAPFDPNNPTDPRSSFRIAFQPTGHDSASVPQVFKMLQHMRDACLAVEEASKWMGSVIGRAEKELIWFVQYGRHNRISQLYLARRFSELDRNVTANCDVIVSFVQNEPIDLQYIRAAAGQEVAERIKALGEHEWDYVRANHDGVVALLESISEGTDNAGMDEPTEPDSTSDAASDGASVDGDSDKDGQDAGNAGVEPTSAGPPVVVDKKTAIGVAEPGRDDDSRDDTAKETRSKTIDRESNRRKRGARFTKRKAKVK